MGSSSDSSASGPVLVELPEDYRELVQIYLETRAADLEALGRALGAADFAAIHRIGHNIRGSSASYGFNAAGDMGLELERAADAGNAALARALGERLRSYFKRLDIRYVTDKS